MHCRLRSTTQPAGAEAAKEGSLDVHNLSRFQNDARKQSSLYEIMGFPEPAMHTFAPFIPLESNFGSGKPPGCSHVGFQESGRLSGEEARFLRWQDRFLGFGLGELFGS